MIVLLYISVTCQSCKILKYCCEFLLASPSSVESLVLSWNSVKFVNNNAGYHKNYEMIPFPLFNWPSNYYEKLDHNFFFINGHGEFWIDNIITILSNRITPKIQIVFPKFSPLEKSTIVEKKMYNFERCVSSWAKLYNSASTPLLWIWHRCVNSRARYFSKKKFVYIASSVLGPILNERSDNCTFTNTSLFLKNKFPEKWSQC